MTSLQERPAPPITEDLIMIVAHDLRGYLTPLKAHIDILRCRAEHEGRTHDLRDALAATAAYTRMQRLIAQLLEATRLEHGLFALALQPVDLAALVRESSAALATPAARIVVQSPTSLPLQADPVRLAQALDNLLLNALQHSPPHMPVTVVLSVEAHGGAEWARVTVQDRGRGIPPERLHRLFDRFSVGPDSQGLGLGLYLARSIAHAHGGQLTVESAVGEGAAFHLDIPLVGPDDFLSAT
jgi:two-component system, OmpR family, sensor kinase